MFLKPLLDLPTAPWKLRNVRSGLVLADKLETAFDSTARRRGLLGRQGLEPGAALIIAPCNSIHTFFMKFAIDAVFVRRDGRVARINPALQPWRIGISWKSFAVIELPAGTIARAETRVGDVLQIVRYEVTGIRTSGRSRSAMADTTAPTNAGDAHEDSEAVPLSVIMASGVSLEWYQATALVQELCALISRAGSPETMVLPDPERILVHPDGVLSIPSADQRTAKTAAAQVTVLARLLLSLVSEGLMPVKLRLLLLSAISDAPPFATVADFSGALAYFERPRRTTDIQAVYSRWRLGPREPEPRAARLPQPAVVEAEKPPAPAKARGRHLAIALVAVIVVLVGGTTAWWFSGRPAFRPLVRASQSATDVASRGWMATRALVASGEAAVRSLLGASPERTSAAAPADVAQPTGTFRARARSGAESAPKAAEAAGLAPQPGAEATVRSQVPADLPVVQAFDLSTSVVGQPATENAALRPSPPVKPESLQPAGTPATGGDVTAPIYSSADRDVEPPVPIQPKIPTALPADEREENLTVVDLIISDDGQVESLRLVRPARGVRETMILSAVKAWRFQPALRNAQPVRYSKRVWLSLASARY